MMKRRSTLGLLAAFLAAPMAARGQSATTIKLGVIPAEPAAEAFYGIDMGFFKQQGLDIDLQVMNNGASVAAAVAGGALDVGFCDCVTIASAHARGVPFLYIAPGILNTDTAPTFGIIVSGTGPIRTAKDMNGKTFAVNAINNISHIPVLAWIDNNGGDSKSMKWIELPLPAIPDAIEAGRIDGGVEGEPFIQFAVSKGERAIFMDKGAIAPRFMLSGWFATKDWIAKNPAVTKSFITAIRQTAEWANKNQAASAPILSKYTKTPMAVIEQMHRGQFAEQLRPSDIQPIIDSAVKYGVIPNRYAAGELFYTPR
jgi:NitT/TauT family transport system substrate-binding protein